MAKKRSRTRRVPKKSIIIKKKQLSKKRSKKRSSRKTQEGGSFPVWGVALGILILIGGGLSLSGFEQTDTDKETDKEPEYRDPMTSASPASEYDPPYYYDILGVPPDANENTIKKSYRKKALEHHPDKGGDEEKFKEVGKAFAVLKDKEFRKIYDSQGWWAVKYQVPSFGGGKQKFVFRSNKI
jgi:hypothetical protein